MVGCNSVGVAKRPSLFDLEQPCFRRMDSIQQLDGSGLAPVIPVNRLLSCPRLNCLIDQKRHVRLDRFELPSEALSHFSSKSDKEFNLLLVLRCAL